MSICNIIQVAGVVIGSILAVRLFRISANFYDVTLSSRIFYTGALWVLVTGAISILVPTFIECYEETVLCKIVEREELLQTTAIESYTITRDGDFFLIGVKDEEGGLTFTKYPLQEVHLYPAQDGQEETLRMEVWTIKEDVMKNTTKSWFRAPGEPPEKEQFVRTKTPRTEYRIYTDDYESVT